MKSELCVCVGGGGGVVVGRMVACLKGSNSKWYSRAAAAKSLQSCPTLCDPIDSSPPGFPVPGILQARTLEWVATVFSNAGKWKVKVKSLSHVQLSATPWTAAHQVPPSMGFSRQEYWSGVPLPFLGYTHYHNLITLTIFTTSFSAESWLHVVFST